jgi:hypothetical protein
VARDQTLVDPVDDQDGGLMTTNIRRTSTAVVFSSFMLVLAAILGACRDEPPPYDWHISVPVLRQRLESGDRGAVADLRKLCCSMLRTFPDEDACPLLERAIKMDLALDNAFDLWGPACYEQVSIETLRATVDRNSERIGDQALGELIWVLGDIDASPEVVAQSVRVLTTNVLPKERNDTMRARHAFERLLGTQADDDLAPLIPMLESSDEDLRKEANWALEYATRAPLDLPMLVPTLERCTHTLAGNRWGASRILAAYREWESMSPDDAVRLLAQALVRDTNLPSPSQDQSGILLPSVGTLTKRDLIRFLSRRRKFCGSRAADLALKTLAADDGPTTAYLAERAIAERARRCAGR